jgi:nitrite reductase/ring-hydroxylating ferredoxin subunit
VILATHLPVVDRVGIFSRAEPMASFAITADVVDPAPDGMFIDAASEYSLRGVKVGSEDLLIVGGQGHRIGTADARRSLDALEAYARERFGATRYPHRWDAHDFVTEDRLPFIGSVQPTSDRVLTATGMNKWGLALGAAAAAMLAADIAGTKDSWPRSFDSKRVPLPRSWPTLAKHSAETGAHFVGGRLKRKSTDELAPGQGAIVGAGLKQCAAFRDESGRLHQVSARCTHLGCIVAFNEPARTWDCPCHGSRFGIDGSVLEGPAVAPLAKRSRETDPGSSQPSR